MYEATTRLHIEMDAPNVVDFEEVIAESRLARRQEYYRTQYEILRSRALARMTMDRLELWEHPAFSGGRRGDGIRSGGGGARPAASAAAGLRTAARDRAGPR